MSRKPSRKTCTLTVEVNYDPSKTDPEGLASAMDTLLDTSLSTKGILDDYGDPKVGKFFVEGITSETIGNWADLARIISKMSPEQQAKPVFYMEGYDNWAIQRVDTLEVAPETQTSKTGDVLPAGMIYLA